MKIAGLQRVTLLDYPEHIAASVFLAGCNLNCGFCHNRWMIRESEVQEALSIEEFFDWLETREGLLDGVCVSGGEPTIHPELPDFVRRIKSLGFDLKLDTNGTLPERLKVLLDEGLVDYVAMDIKAPLDSRYNDVAGVRVNLEAIRQSMQLIRTKAPAYEFRTTVGPLLDAEALEEIAHEIGELDRWYLQPFERVPTVDPVVAEADALEAQELEELIERLAKIAPGVQLRAT